jgi:hypothetical protein
LLFASGLWQGSALLQVLDSFMLNGWLRESEFY